MISCPTFAFMWGPLRLRGSTGWGGESREVFPTWNFVPNIVVNLFHLSWICQLHSEGDCRRGDGEWWGRLWKQLVGWGQGEKHTLYLFPKFNNFSIRFHMGVKKTRRLDQSYLHLRGSHTNRLGGGIWGNSQMSTTDPRMKWPLWLCIKWASIGFFLNSQHPSAACLIGQSQQCWHTRDEVAAQQSWRPSSDL